MPSTRPSKPSLQDAGRVSPPRRQRRDRAGDGAGMMPDLELVELDASRSFRVFSHGYPYRTVRWHFHPEYEIHLVVETTGRAFVGDYLGTFEPGNLVMTGPSVPHNCGFCGWTRNAALSSRTRPRSWPNRLLPHCKTPRAPSGSSCS